MYYPAISFLRFLKPYSWKCSIHVLHRQQKQSPLIYKWWIVSQIARINIENLRAVTEEIDRVSWTLQKNPTIKLGAFQKTLWRSIKKNKGPY